MAELLLIVGGRRYGGWKSVRVTRSIESLAGRFDLEVSDRWGSLAEPWPIAEEDACRLAINGTTVLDGFVDKRDPSFSASQRRLSYSGRDRAASLVDCSALLTKWTYRDVSIADFAATLAKPFNVQVSVQPGLKLDKVRKVVVNPGDTVYEAIRTAAADAEVLIVSDGAGGILITRHGTGRATALIEGQNIWSGSLAYDGTERFHRYVILAQSAATDQASGQAVRVKAEAIDEGCRRKNRVLLIRPTKGYSVEDARRRVDWEARIRAARSETAIISVRGWTQPGGELWPLNALVAVRARKLLGVDGEMLISQIEHSIDDQGEVTQLRLVRPDAFAPEPEAKVRASGGAWKELAGGAL